MFVLKVEKDFVWLCAHRKLYNEWTRSIIMKSKVLIILFLLLLCAAPASAVTYSEEYYKLGDITNTSWNKISGVYFGSGQDYPTAEHLTFLELRRQTILLEKQNDLQAELVKAKWVETCYRPIYAGNGSGNNTAWKSECANAGYPVG